MAAQPTDQPPATHAPRRAAVERLSWLAGVLGLAVGVLFVLAVYGAFRSAMTQYSESARLVSDLVEDSVTRTLESAETTLLAVAAAADHALDQESGHGADRPSLHDHDHDHDDLPHLVAQTMLFAPYMRQVVVADADGRVLMDSAGPARNRRVDLNQLDLPLSADGRWQPRHSASLHRGLILGTALPGRYLPMLKGPADPSPRRVVPATVRVGADRLVIGALNPASLRHILDHGRRGPSGAVWLTRLDGTPVITAQDNATSILRDRTLPLMPLVSKGVESGLLPLSKADGTGVAGHAAFRLSERYPLAVVVAVARRDGEQAWLEANGTMLFWGMLSLIGLLAGGALLLRETLRRGRLESRLRLVGLTEAVFAHSTEAMVIADGDRRVLAANPSFLVATGHDAEDVVGRPVSDFLSPAEDADADADHTPSGLDHQGWPRGVWRLWCRSGEVRSIDYREAPLFQDATILTLTDITDRIAAERALSDALQRAELANRAKTEFLASMSHELRTPLNAILGFSEILRDQVFGPVGSPQYRDYAMDIHSSGSHLRDIINDLLDLAKIEAGKFELDPAPLDINDEVAACCRLVSERLNDHGLTLTLGRPLTDPMLLVDDRVFRQMLFNLLSNAIKFTPPGGRIWVSGHHDDHGRLHVAVRDTGIGISPTELGRIFRAYERAINTETRHIEGSGLGLALVKSMMDLHGGTVTVDSTPDQGSTFTLVFPAARCLPRIETG